MLNTITRRNFWILFIADAILGGLVCGVLVFWVLGEGSRREGREQRVESRGQRAEGKRVRGQRAEGKRIRGLEDGGHPSEMRFAETWSPS